MRLFARVTGTGIYNGLFITNLLGPTFQVWLASGNDQNRIFQTNGIPIPGHPHFPYGYPVVPD